MKLKTQLFMKEEFIRFIVKKQNMEWENLNSPAFFNRNMKKSQV